MLSENQILTYLNTLNEHKMAKDIFVNVLKNMGLKGVRFTGGSNEQGIDLEYYELTEPEKHKSYVGIQFKKGDLTYSARGTKNSIKEIKNQAEEAFEKGISDFNSSEVHYIGRYIVATTGEINSLARDMINKAKAKGQDRRINYWDGEKLAEYIQEYWMEEFIVYFNAEDEEEEVEVEVKNIIDQYYIEDNYSELVKNCTKVRATVSGLEWDILYTIVKLSVFEGNSHIFLSDLLYELGKSEDYLSSELKNLVQRLEYLGFDDNEIYLSGKAVNLSKLAEKIIEELVDAEESEENAEDIFNELF